MLRSITLSFVSLLAISTLHAQHASFGVKAGLNASTYQGSDVPNPRFRLGPAAGVLMRLPLGQHLDLQPELLYEQRGSRTSYSNDYTTPAAAYLYTYQERSRLHYLSLPVLLRLHKEKWFAVLGPQGSYLLTAQRRITATNTLTAGAPDPAIATGSFRTTSQALHTYHRLEPGYVLGAGYQVAARVGVELRYVAGLLQVRRSLLYESGLPTSRASIARNRVLQAQVSYQLGKL